MFPYRTRHPLRLLLGAALVLAPATAWAAQTSADASYATASADDGAGLSVDQADSLSPGQFVWADEPDATGAVHVMVDLDRQVAYVYRGPVLIGITTVSTGREGHPTPVGEFTILQKQVDHHSTLYDDAAMPYMQRLTWDGVALHAGGVPGYRESHGCVHLPMGFAKKLYEVTSLGATVDIVGTPDPDQATTTIASNDQDEADSSAPVPAQ